MKNLKLGSQLNIAFAFVMFVPMIIATVFSIVYYSNKIEQEAINTINSDLKTANIIYQNKVIEINNLAKAYARKDAMKLLLLYDDLGEKIGNEFARLAQLDNIDMITITDISYKVLVRSHAPRKTGDVFPEKEYISTALAGISVGGTETLTIQELEQEGAAVDLKLLPDTSKILALTGAAPVYNRESTDIIGVIVVRRILNNTSEIVKNIGKHLNIRSALFEQTCLIASDSGSKENGEFVPLPDSILRDVLNQNYAISFVSISKGGNISNCMPIHDFNNKNIGVLMVQRGVEKYLHTRDIAIITLLTVFLIGLILAFIIKTIIERRIVNPLQRLKQAAEQIGSGQYDYAPDITSGDEIGELALSFKKMAGDLSQYDKQLKEYNLQLIKANKELNNKHIQLIQTAKLASLGELSAGVAHELNQPLMVIRSTSQIMLRKFEKLSSEQIQEQLTLIERNTKRMMNIINHLRTFSRQTPSEMIAVDINQIIEDAFLMIGEQLRLRNIRVEKNFEPDLSACYGNSNQLEQVFLNMIANAKDAILEKMTHENDFTGKLEIITRKSYNHQQVIEIIFKDNGIGISSEYQNKLFDPFFTTKEVGKGTGLGLSISYGIIKDHHGSIDVMETSSEGTTFRIMLPFQIGIVKT